MNYRTFHTQLAITLLAALWLTAKSTATAQAPRDAVEILRGDVKANRNAMIAEEMKLTDKESEAFWPIYRNYRAEADKVTDRIVELVFEYGDLYPNVPEQRAKDLLTQYMKVESDLLGIKRKYLKKFGKVLPASKVFRFAQLDNRYDLGTRVGLAACIPILPAGQAQPASAQH